MSMFDLFKKGSSDSGEAKDPICGMKINLNQTQYQSTYMGKTYGFCSSSCKETFDKQTAEKNSGSHSGHSGHSCC